MSYRNKLFTHRALYDGKDTDALFLHAMKENILFHQTHCPTYGRILDYYGFHAEDLKTADNLCRIPALPTLFYKTHEMYSMPRKKLWINVTSSGTKGRQSRMGYDVKSLWLALRMALKTFSHHKLFSIWPTNYIVLGYQPSKQNTMSAVKTAFGSTLFAPALHREYALKFNGTGYDLNEDGIKEALLRYSKSVFPVRLIGFPAYVYFLIQSLQKMNIRLKLPKGSKVFLAGGWKQFMTEKVDKEQLLRLIEETLGVAAADCKDFFGAVEHPVLYCDCKHHHFHVPVYSRVIIRDVKTLQPVENGTPGLLNLISPLVGSMPLVSVMTDDIAILHEGESCGCGIMSPWFEILGRVGLQGIKTCAAGAAERLEGFL